MIEKAIELLTLSARKFRFYEDQHRAKNTEESLVKAKVNAEMAARIEDFVCKYYDDLDNKRYYS